MLKTRFLKTLFQGRVSHTPETREKKSQKVTSMKISTSAFLNMKLKALSYIISKKMFSLSFHEKFQAYTKDGSIMEPQYSHYPDSKIIKIFVTWAFSVLSVSPSPFPFLNLYTFWYSYLQNVNLFLCIKIIFSWYHIVISPYKNFRTFSKESFCI